MSATNISFSFSLNNKKVFLNTTCFFLPLHRFHNIIKKLKTMKRKKGLLCTVAIGLAALTACQSGSNAPCEKENSCESRTDSAVVVDAIMARRSIRKYKETPVRRDQMDVIIQCGINAPSGMNKQPWAVRVVDDQEFLNGLTELWLESQSKEAATKTRTEPGFRNMFRNAPTVVFIAAPADGNGNLDCGLLGENMMLAAQSMGIGSCCLGGPIRFLKTVEASEYVSKLQLPDGYELLYAIGMGYPDEAPAAKPRDTEKAFYVN